MPLSARAERARDVLDQLAARMRAVEHGVELNMAEYRLLHQAASGHPTNIPETCRLLQSIGAGQPTENVRQLAQDAIARIRPDHIRVPSGGIRYMCEACGQPAKIQRRRRMSVCIPWFSVLGSLWDTRPGELAAKLEKHGLPPERVGGHVRQDAEGRTWIGRRIVVCAACLRGQMRRCAHQERMNPAGDRIDQRCTRIVTGHPIYCEQHRTRGESFRRTDTNYAQRDPDSQRTPRPTSPATPVIDLDARL